VGSNGQKGDSHPKCDRGDGGGQHEILSCCQDSAQFKTYELFIYGIFHLMFYD
jgi:hypothetical protein